LGIGAGVRTNPLVGTADLPLVLVPQVNYNGERFFIQNLDFGVIVWQNDSQQLNLLATPSYDQVFFHRWSPGNFFIDGSIFSSIDRDGSRGKNNLIENDGIGEAEFAGPEFLP